jgi:hypothetical protein
MVQNPLVNLKTDVLEDGLLVSPRKERNALVFVQVNLRDRSKTVLDGEVVNH